MVTTWAISNSQLPSEPGWPFWTKMKSTSVARRSSKSASGMTATVLSNCWSRIKSVERWRIADRCGISSEWTSSQSDKEILYVLNAKMDGDLRAFTEKPKPRHRWLMVDDLRSFNRINQVRVISQIAKTYFEVLRCGSQEVAEFEDVYYLMAMNWLNMTWPQFQGFCTCFQKESSSSKDHSVEA